MNSRLSLLAGAGAALALAACNPPHPKPHVVTPLKVVDALVCPDDEGVLTRKSIAPDNKSCEYATDDGGQVTLQLVSLDGGDANAALSPLEAKLRGEMPPPNKTAGTPGADKDRVDIDLPGIHIHANGSDHDADGGAQVKVGNSTAASSSHAGGAGVTVNAGDNGAEIHINEPGGGVRRSFILASDTPGPSGYKMVGYEARGPQTGPLVVATMMAKTDDHDELRDAVRDLLKANVGG